MFKESKTWGLDNKIVGALFFVALCAFVMFIVGIAVMAQGSRKHANSEQLSLYNQVVDAWNDIYRDQFLNQHYQILVSAGLNFTQLTLPEEHTTQPGMHNYSPLKYFVPLKILVGPAHTFRPDATTITLGNIGSKSPTQFYNQVVPFMQLVNYSAAVLGCQDKGDSAACSRICKEKYFGKWSSSERTCSVSQYLSNFCVKLVANVEIDNKYNGGGCYYDSSYVPTTYSLVKDKNFVDFSGVRIEIRSVADPYIYLGYLTKGTYNIVSHEQVAERNRGLAVFLVGLFVLMITVAALYYLRRKYARSEYTYNPINTTYGSTVVYS